MITADNRADITNLCPQTAGLHEKGYSHKELQCGRLRRDEADVGHLVDTRSNWCNPFSAAENDLTCLSFGLAAGEEVKISPWSTQERYCGLPTIYQGVISDEFCWIL